jgi:hypothetical protein
VQKNKRIGKIRNKIIYKSVEKMQIQLKGLINPSLPTPLGETGGAQLGPLAPNSSASPLSLARGLCTKYAHY